MDASDLFSLQVTIPSNDTTYWCASFRLPDQLINTVHYVNEVSIHQ